MLTNFLLYFAFFILTPLRPLYLCEQFGATKDVIGIVLSGYVVASVILGACSVVPQIFVPMAGLFSRPEQKSRYMGFALSGLLTGVLLARVIGGYVGGWLGRRLMFRLVAFVILLSLMVNLRLMPVMHSSFSGSYRSLIATWARYMSHILA